MTRRLTVGDQEVADASDDAIAERLRGDGFFWLDLHEPDQADFTLMRRVFGFHPLAVEDAENFGQRAKVEEYDDVVFLVAFGAAPLGDEDRLVEVHCFYCERFLVTVHRDEAPGLAEAARRCDARPELLQEPAFLLYHVLDALVDSFFPVMDEIDDRIDDIEVKLDQQPDDTVQNDIFSLRRELMTIRKAISPQRDQMARIATGTVSLPGMSMETRRYFRDVEDHLIRMAGIIDGYRDLLSGATEAYQSAVNNRLNLVMKNLTAISGIFLPLALVTGFFGQNFSWMVEHVGGPVWFFVLGVGLQLVLAVTIVAYFHRRGWL